MGFVIGQFDKRSDKSLSVEDSEFCERTVGGTAIFFSVLFVSTCISGYGIWQLAEYLISKFH
ncbi:MAG: hypothetical protein WA138_01270 [Parvibaculum sp.]